MEYSSCNEYINNAMTNNFVAWKHGQVIAAVLLRAQLWVNGHPSKSWSHQVAFTFGNWCFNIVKTVCFKIFVKFVISLVF